ncbi:MAG: amidohydrolase family protein [Phycisphaerales bacterium]|nr:amidohydrolase family protein [Phycisphaerales bacterium]
MLTHLTRGLLAALAFGSVAALAQPTSTSPLAPPPNGVRRLDPGAPVGEAGRFALTGATVHTAPGKTIENATVLIRAGRIESVGPAGAAAPPGVQVREAAGTHIYPGFIEPYLEVDVPAPDADAPGVHWNPNVTPQRTALDKGSRGVDDRTARSLREMGFTAAAISPRAGIFRGSSSVVSLADMGRDPSGSRPRTYRDHAYQCVGLDPVRAGGRGDDSTPDSSRWSGYPNSQMGAIALVRQTLSDADWQQQARAGGQFNDAHNALDALAKPPAAAPTPNSPSGADRAWDGLLLFDAADELEALRCAKIADEFKRPAAILGSGQEYQRLEAVVSTRLPLILPLVAPRAPQVGSIGEQNNTELAELMHWEQAPTNPRRVDAALAAAGRASDLCLTTSKSADRAGGGGGRRGRPVVDSPESQPGPESAGAGGSRSSFADRLGSAIRHGLPADRALAMLTINPARLLGLERDLGTVEPGKVANLVVADGPLFTDRPDAPKKDEPGYIKPGRITGVWIDGREHIIRSLPPIPVGGRYELTLDPPPQATLRITFDIDDSSSPDRPDLRITKTTPDEAHPDDASKDKSVEINVTDFTVRNTTFRFSFEHEPFGEKGVFVNSGVIEKSPDGTTVLRAEGVRSSGKIFNWTARRTGPAAPRKRSLAGAWPLLFDAPGAASNTPLLVFDQGNIPTIQPAPGLKQAVEGKPLKIDNFSYDGAKFSYAFDQSQMLGQDGKPLEGVAQVEATMDWTTNPPRLSGTLSPPDGAGAPRLAFTSIRRARNPFAGDWRITQADGVAHDLNSPDGLTITIKGGGTQSGPGTGGGGRRGRGRAAEAAGDGSASRGPTVTLTFTRKDKPPTLIEASEIEQRGGKLFFLHALEKLGAPGESRDELTIAWNKDDPGKDILIGLGRTSADSAHAYQAARVIKPDDIKRETAAIASIPEKLPLPFGPYGLEAQPAPGRFLITNATIWTCKDGTADTVIPNGAVVISDGKISYVGPSASLPRLTDGFTTIDAKGKFVTPGIIDCHSHTGISRGVNESGQAVTAEVRIGDVTNPDDVSWYRQLAGGVTCVNNLHGSANAIGGQSMVNKIRWGCARPDDMHFERATALALEGSASTTDPQARGALPGIKFALGENPKQSNWGDRSVTRYPQTRMGVETLIRDRFTAAKEYGEALKKSVVGSVANGNGDLVPHGAPRRDLELEALAQVLAGTRLVHCHSYRQDEILMLTRVARDFNFKIGTFQHILEGYKVADELVRHSGGGSAFSDWWAYKIEVQDAIPAAGPLMAEQGVTVSYNSDSDEMARRLNVEAGKATKYSRNNKGGAISPHEAFKFVTLNPAKQLHIDKFTGTLEAGKDADVAIWSGAPTSPTSRCETTFVDGRRLFSLELDSQHRDHIASERARLIQKALANPDRGGRDAGEGAEVAADFDVDYDSAATNLQIELSLQQARAVGRRLMLLEAQRSADDYIREQNLDLIRRGLDPRWMRAGDCGCGF